MKNKIKLFGLIALAVALIFTMTACKDPGKSDTGGNAGLNGTWVNSKMGIRVVMDKGAFTMSEKEGTPYVEKIKGTYIAGESNITMTYTQIKGSMFGSDAELTTMGLSKDTWYTKEQLKSAITQKFLAIGMPQTQINNFFENDVDLDEVFPLHLSIYTLSGNTLTMNLEGIGTIVFTKQ